MSALESMQRAPEGDEGALEKLRGLDNLVIVTTTRYGTDEQSRVRQELGLKLLANASGLGVRTIVVDGGSNEDFLQKARSIPGVTLIPEITNSTMGAGRRQALSEAMNLEHASTFLWIEPEKDTLVAEKPLGDMIANLKFRGADIVVPRRKDKSSLPKFQRWIEPRANKRAAELMGERNDGGEKQETEHGDQKKQQGEIDLWFGPKMFTREGARYFSEYDGKGIDKWDSIIGPVINAARDGKKIESVDVDYVYDQSQVDAETDNSEIDAKRVDQYRQIFAALGDPFWSREGKGIENGRPKRTELKRKRDHL